MANKYFKYADEIIWISILGGTILPAGTIILIHSLRFGWNMNNFWPNLSIEITGAIIGALATIVGIYISFTNENRRLAKLKRGEQNEDNLYLKEITINCVSDIEKIIDDVEQFITNFEKNYTLYQISDLLQVRISQEHK